MPGQKLVDANRKKDLVSVYLAMDKHHKHHYDYLGLDHVIDLKS